MESRCVKFLCVAVFASIGLLASCSETREHAPTAAARWHNNQGVAYMDQHNYTRAEREFNGALDSSPDYALAHANLGIALFSLGRYDSATVALSRALELNPSLLQAQYTMGLIVSAQGRDYARAAKFLERVVAADPDDPHALYYLGQAKAKLGRTEEAIRDFQRAIQLDPNNVSAHYALANQYRQLGQRKKWRAELERFNELTREGYEGVSSSYQGQGVYAEAVADVAVPSPGAGDSGVALRFASSQPLPGPSITPAAVAVADLDGDQRSELCVATDSLFVYSHQVGTAPSSHQRICLGAVPANCTSLAAADWDNDGDVDLLLGASGIYLSEQSDGKWLSPVLLAPHARGLNLADVDHDGDLDLITTTPQGLQVLFNDGLGHVLPADAATTLTPRTTTRIVRFTDVDNDRDTDIVSLDPGGVEIFGNNRDGTFSPLATRLGLPRTGAWVDVRIEDLNQDGFMDLLLLRADGSLHELINHKGRTFVAQPAVQLPAGRYGYLVAADFDLDGDMDAAAGGSAGVYAIRRHEGRFEPPNESAISAPVRATTAVLDWDGDGRPDLLADGRVVRNETRAGHWLRVALRGKGSNRGGLGAKIQVKTTHFLQKREVTQSAPLEFGVGPADSVEFIRVLWPSGVRQTELAMPTDRTLVIDEVDRKGTSCPVVYVWDGNRYRFVSDINGGAIIGYLIGPHEYYVSDTDEYLPLGAIAPRDGYYTVQFGNHLEEVIYADALQLVAIDHPSSVRVFPNERLLSAPPYPPFELYALTDLRPPRTVTDQAGRDVTAQLQLVDDAWYDGFTRTDIHGYVRDFYLDLDLGTAAAGPAPVLVAHGWVDYAHSTSNWAAAQRGWTLYPPRLEIPDGNGGWRVVCADMGTPAGLPKDMLFDLSKVLPPGTRRIRIATNMAVYWDRFLIGQRRAVPLKVQRLTPAVADLHWRGYPQHTAVNHTFAFRYHYDRLRQEAPWSSHAGRFTRFGRVDDLVAQVDDRFVIMSHGDELTLKFDAAALAPPDSGLVRSFLLYSDGFGKDMDFHSAYSLTVDPLPFHGMSRYPYGGGETYPLTAATRDYLESYNTRASKGYY